MTYLEDTFNFQRLWFQCKTFDFFLYPQHGIDHSSVLIGLTSAVNLRQTEITKAVENQRKQLQVLSSLFDILLQARKHLRKLFLVQKMF